MAGLGNYEPLGTAVGEVGGQVLIDVRDDRFRETLLVSFQSQDIVGLARNDLLGDGRLCSPRVDGEDRPFGLDQLQEFGNRRDFIRFGLGRDLTQRQSLVRRPQTDRVHRPPPFGPILAPPQCLAVHRRDRSSDPRGRRRTHLHGLQPARETGLKRARI